MRSWGSPLKRCLSSSYSQPEKSIWRSPAVGLPFGSAAGLPGRDAWVAAVLCQHGATAGADGLKHVDRDLRHRKLRHHEEGARPFAFTLILDQQGTPTFMESSGRKIPRRPGGWCASCTREPCRFEGHLRLLSGLSCQTAPAFARTANGKARRPGDHCGLCRTASTDPTG
jgi:hypothetical protein